MSTAAMARSYSANVLQAVTQSASANPVQAAVMAGERAFSRAPRITPIQLKARSASWPGICGTLLCHSAVVATNLALLAASEDRGLSSLQICALHCAFLLGTMNPPSVLVRWNLWWSPAPDTYGALLMFAIGIAHFLGVGIVEFGNQTERIDMGSLADLTFVDRLYFCMVLITTVGYGHQLVPPTPTSRLFTVCFALKGLIVFGAGTAVVTGALSMLVDDVRALFKRIFRVRERMKPAIEPSSAFVICRNLLVMFVAFLGVNFGSAVVFYAVEDGWRFNDALYHCFMTATTIGLGDIAPTTQAGRGFAIVHMAVSAVLFATIIGRILGAHGRRSFDARRERLIDRQLDEDLLVSRDRDGNGVDKTECVAWA